MGAHRAAALDRRHCGRIAEELCDHGGKVSVRRDGIRLEAVGRAARFGVRTGSGITARDRIDATNRGNQAVIPDTAVFERSPAYSACPVDRAAVILNAEKHLYFAVNRVGARIWLLLEEPRSLDSLVKILTSEFDVAPAKCRREIEAFLGQLIDRRMVERRD